MTKNTKNAFGPADYMQMAVDAMMNSRAEPRDDGKVSPKVGAVLVKPDGAVQLGWRGELRFGDHAEFTLIERKNRSEALDGSILYSTLEPCAPGARRHPKLGCAERIVNARIEEVWVGIEDPDPEVDRKGIAFLEANGVKVRMFYPEFQKIIRQSNSDFLDQATERAGEKKKQEELLLSDLEKPITVLDPSSFSEEAIRFYLEKAKVGFQYDSEEQWQHFENAGIVERVEKGNTTHIIPTGFGLLLFGWNPRERYQQAVVKAKVRYGNNNSSPRDFEGPLVLIPGEIELWLEQILHSEISRKKFERKTQSQYPIEPLREAIINALVHRDYDMSGAKTFIEIDDDKIVVKSAGTPVSPISLEDVRAFRAPSLSRNPKITYIFNKMGFMEEAELGMETFRGMQEKYGLPLPFYEYRAPYLSITFPRSLESAKLISSDDAVNELSDEELAGFEWVKSKGNVSKNQYADHFKIDEKKAYRHLAKFKKLGLVGDNGESSKSNKFRYVFQP